MRANIMRNKVLIADAHKKDQKALELILQEVLQEGGELLFADTTAVALEILATERPQLIFLDYALLGSDEDIWVKWGAQIVLTCNRNIQPEQGEDVLLKPFEPQQVLEKCRGVLDLGRLEHQTPSM